jgi:hypothetical protein
MLARRSKGRSVRFLNWDKTHQPTLRQGSHDEITPRERLFCVRPRTGDHAIPLRRSPYDVTEMSGDQLHEIGRIPRNLAQK